MAKTSVFEPLFDDGLRSINFFNGRLLSGEDLTTEKKANREARRRLAQAIGDGVVHGLTVRAAASNTREAPAVTVGAGLAINRVGDAIWLPADTDVSLLTGKATAAATSGVKVEAFDYCLPPSADTYVAGAGVYLLAIRAASGGTGLAPVSGLGNELAGCNTRFVVDGVRFVMASVPAQTELADIPHLRNRLAHRCFGAQRLAAFTVDPFGQSRDYGLLADLRDQNSLTDCDVPLALIYWTTDGIQFVDAWAVRRRPVARQAAQEPWRAAVERRRMAEAEAMLWQFQEQLAQLVLTSSNPAALEAKGTFDFLPPAGLVPLRNNLYPFGATTAAFFKDIAYGPAKPIQAAQVRPLLCESLLHEPIDLTSSVRVQLYSVAENMSAQSGTNPPQRFVLFATDHLPYVSQTPRFADLCQTLKDAIAAYMAVLAKNIFLPNETDPRVVAARTAIVLAARDVVNVARQHTGLSCAGWALPVPQALDALRDLYTAQKALAAALKTNWPGVADPTNIQEFGDGLLQLLDGSSTALGPALNKPSLPDAIAAQNRINGLVRTWGEESVVGQITVQYVRSMRGLTLVVNDSKPFNYIFKVTNITNRTLDILLSASFSPPKQAWSSSIKVLDMNGNDLPSITLDPFDAANPTNPAAFREVQASVVTPAGAAAPDTATLVFRAEAPAPASVADDEPLTLKVGTAEESEVPRVVLTLTTVQGTPGNAIEGEAVVFIFSGTFSTPQAPFTRDFRAAVSLTNTPVADRSKFDVVLVDLPPESPPSTEPRSAPFAMTSGRKVPITIQVTPLTGSLNKKLSASLKLESTTGGIQASLAFSVTVKRS